MRAQEALWAALAQALSATQGPAHVPGREGGRHRSHMGTQAVRTRRHTGVLLSHART